jgi:hypothetical protein
MRRSACEQLRLMVFATGGAAAVSAVNFAAGIWPLGVVAALMAVYGLTEVYRLQQECQREQQRA